MLLRNSIISIFFLISANNKIFTHCHKQNSVAKYANCFCFLRRTSRGGWRCEARGEAPRAVADLRNDGTQVVVAGQVTVLTYDISVGSRTTTTAL